ncbi:MAG: hypothetical protein QOE45_33 [Frankiaceae bacterium]|jgi:hypothetical protein|nr:hypothetical protein [Frankiaceae bacterium]
MDVRKIIGTLVAVPVLVLALAGPSEAASTGAIGFAGTVTLVPQSTGSTAFCFFGAPTATCGNGVPSTGIAAGTAAAGLQPAVIDGLEGSATYADTCVNGVPLTGVATVTANVHELVGASIWRGSIAAQWSRAGLVAVLSGDATGAALFVPVGPALCGAPATFVVAGSAEITY